MEMQDSKNIRNHIDVQNWKHLSWCILKSTDSDSFPFFPDLQELLKIQKSLICWTGSMGLSERQIISHARKCIAEPW